MAKLKFKESIIPDETTPSRVFSADERREMDESLIRDKVMPYCSDQQINIDQLFKYCQYLYQRVRALEESQ